MSRLSGAIAVAVVCTSSLGAQTAERRTIPGADVAIYNLAGEARVRAGTGSQVIVEITRGGPDADQLEIQTGPLRGHETLRVVYPGRAVLFRRPGNQNSTLTVSEDGTFGEDGHRAGRQVRIGSRGEGLDAHADLDIRVPAGKRLTLHLAVGRVQVTNVDGDLRIESASADVTAAGVRGTLFVDTGSGNVDLTDVDAELNVDTGSGNVSVDGVRGTNLRFDTGSGNVTGTDVEAEQLVVDVGSGNIQLAGVESPDAKFDAGSGNIDVSLARDVQSLRIDTGSGDVRLAVPASLGADLSVETGSGSITSDVSLEVRKSERRSLTGRLGDGRGRIEIDTGSGSVRLLRTGAAREREQERDRR